jgi:carbamoylphosphate synthase small subunit
LKDDISGLNEINVHHVVIEQTMSINKSKRKEKRTIKSSIDFSDRFMRSNAANTKERTTLLDRSIRRISGVYTPRVQKQIRRPGEMRTAALWKTARVKKKKKRREKRKKKKDRVDPR